MHYEMEAGRMHACGAASFEAAGYVTLGGLSTPEKK
jgi:hypothetical protein